MGVIFQQAPRNSGCLWLSKGSPEKRGSPTSKIGILPPAHMSLCTNPCGTTTFLLERAFLHFHLSWCESTQTGTLVRDPGIFVPYGKPNSCKKMSCERGALRSRTGHSPRPPANHLSSIDAVAREVGAIQGVGLQDILRENS